MTIIRHHVDIYWNWIWSHRYVNHKSSHWLYSNIPAILFQHTWFSDCQPVESMVNVFWVYVWMFVHLDYFYSWTICHTSHNHSWNAQIVLEQSSKSKVIITTWIYIEIYGDCDLFKYWMFSYTYYNNIPDMNIKVRQPLGLL